ncbi:Spore Coat U Domain-Containing protein [Enterobacter hormaechei]|nr:Spore Coat U Domain-Containing protein [Enterobacter hormaechei]VAF78209.1 Spore Coat U Domain-Containing protein [Enterobacter hormaechei]
MSARQRRGRRAPFFDPVGRADVDPRRRGGDVSVIQGERDGCAWMLGEHRHRRAFRYAEFRDPQRRGERTGQHQLCCRRRVVHPCTPGVALSMSINGGQNYSSVRRMTRSGGTEVVGYRLYSSSSLAANSEIGVNQAIPITYTNSNNIALPLFGVALLTGFSPSGTYSDQLTVTLSW